MVPGNGGLTVTGLVNGAGTVNFAEVGLEATAGVATGAAFGSSPGAALQKQVQNMLGNGGNGGTAHVARTQMTKLANGTTNSVSSQTAQKIGNTMGVDTIAPSAVRMMTGSQRENIAQQLPELSGACAASTRECGQ